jgi:hypothetical protein
VPVPTEEQQNRIDEKMLDGGVKKNTDVTARWKEQDEKTSLNARWK